jgi:DNA-binding PadR family transcriptional regulator
MFHKHLHRHCNHPHPFPPMPPHRFRHRGPKPPHGPPPWVVEMLGAHSRPERGEVRWLVLEALEDGPKHGYGIIQVIEQRTSGAYKPSPGSIYPTLQLLEEMELVVCEREGSRKSYSLTDAGRAELEEHREDVEQSYGRLGGDLGWTEHVDFHSLGRRVVRTLRAVRTGVRRGRIGKSELQRIREVMDRALDEVESILKG